MAQGIERRLRQELFAFLLVDKDYYEDLSRPTALTSSYQGFLQDLLPAGWDLRREGWWIHCIPQGVEIPGQGFKIHLSAVSRDALEVLQSTTPVCIEAGVPFKVLAADFLLDHVNSKNGSRTSAGKFVTVYPQDRSMCLDLLERLDNITRHLRGPYILSDRPFRDSRTVFYRYGSFRGLFRLNIFGEKEMLMRGSEGELIPETRAPFFRLPQGVSDLLPGNPTSRNKNITLRGRYAVSHAIRFSNAGGIYEAEDLESRCSVVIKEARPAINLSRRNSVDAIETLRKEATILQIMQETPFVPRLVDFFDEWEHCFLVEEFLKGTPLSSFRALRDVGLLVRRPFSPQNARDFCRTFAHLASNLLNAVRTFHEHGILLGDLSPNNILVDRTSLDVKFIDFEGSFFSNRENKSGETTATMGFISPRRMQGQTATFADDYYALGSTLYSVIFPVQEIFPANPVAERSFLSTIARDFDLPAEVGEIIFSLLAGNIERAHAALTALSTEVSIRDFHLCFGEGAAITKADIEKALHGVRDHLLASADLGRSDRLWPADYRVFSTNPLSLGYGALGTALFLRELEGDVPQNIKEWITGRSLNEEKYPPGLFVGLSGIAWALDELGESERAIQAMDLALSSPLLDKGPDIFYGMAGVGLACLYFWSKTRQDRFLLRACEIAASLKATASTDPDGLYWVNADDVHYFGFAHGGAGISFFLLRLYEATHDSQYLEQGKAALEYEIRHAVEEPDDSITLPRTPSDLWLSPYWRFGASGFGSVLIRYSVTLGDERYRTLAEKAARFATVRLTVFPGQFVGLSGVGEFLLDMYNFTGDSTYLRDAWRLAEGLLIFQVQRPEGILFPGEELVRFTTDYGTGSAGIGLFLLRLLRPRARRFYEFPLDSDDRESG